MTAPTLEALDATLLEALRDHPQGLSEYELISHLQRTAPERFAPGLFRDSLQLFKAHFLLYHCLYRLREHLWRTQGGHLDINPLRMTLHPYRPASAAVAHADPLRDYYSDIANLEVTTAEEVERLLSGFQQALAANERRQEALETMGLTDPVDAAAIKHQYRRLAMQCHPDRGGDKERLQALNAAMAILQRDIIGPAK